MSDSIDSTLSNPLDPDVVASWVVGQLVTCAPGTWWGGKDIGGQVLEVVHVELFPASVGGTLLIGRWSGTTTRMGPHLQSCPRSPESHEGRHRDQPHADTGRPGHPCRAHGLDSLTGPADDDDDHQHDTRPGTGDQ